MNGSDEKAFVDQKFDVVPDFKVIPKGTTQLGTAGAVAKIAVQPLTDEETLGFVKGILSLPHAFIIPKIPQRTDEQLKPFSHELKLYCEKKGIDIREWFFDEFGIIVTGAALAGGYFEDYKKYYGKKEQTKEDKRLDADYVHAQDVAKKNEEQKEHKEVENNG